MTQLNRLFAAGLMAAWLAAGTAAIRAEPVPKLVPDYTVFVDPPTGFVFVKLPVGWKFVGTVSPQDIAKVPAQVVTNLIQRDNDEKPDNHSALRTTP